MKDDLVNTSPVQQVCGLHHFAWRCRDAEETRRFYEVRLELTTEIAATATVEGFAATAHDELSAWNQEGSARRAASPASGSRS